MFHFRELPFEYPPTQNGRMGNNPKWRYRYVFNYCQYMTSSHKGRRDVKYQIIVAFGQENFFLEKSVEEFLTYFLACSRITWWSQSAKIQLGDFVLQFKECWRMKIIKFQTHFGMTAENRHTSDFLAWFCSGPFTYSSDQSSYDG